MNNYDRAVGQGIGSLLQAGHEDVSEAGAFNFAPKSEPVLRMAVGGMIPEDTSYYEEPDLLSIVGGQPTQTIAPNNADILTGLYQDVFKRAPDQGGFDFWLNAMNTMGYTPEMIRDEFVKSPEYAALTAPSTTVAPATTTTTAPVIYSAPSDYETTEQEIQNIVAPAPAPTTAAPTTIQQPSAVDLNSILYGGPQQNLTVQNAVATAERVAKEKAAPVTATNLIQQLNLNVPEFTQGADFTNVGRMADESTGVIQAPTTEFGGYTVKALGQYADVGEGSYAPTGTLGGYEATKTETQANGKPLISTLTYDPSGNLTGSTVRAYEGSDSGTEYQLDATGKVIGSRKFDESEAWKGTVLPLLNMAAIAGMPWLSGVLGGGVLGAAGAGALFGGAGAALQGKEGSDLLKAAALGGASSAVGAGLAGQAGKAAGEFAGNLFAGSEDLASLATGVAKGAVESGIKALPGAIATGDTGRLLTGALTGGALGAVNSLTSDIELPFTQKQAEAGINLVRAVNSGNLISAANAAATLINNPDITIATRAATLLKAVQSGNPSAILAAGQMLANAAGGSNAANRSGGTRTAEAPGGAFETSAIIDEFGDTGGTLVPGEAGDTGQADRVEVTGAGAGAADTDLSSLINVTSTPRSLTSETKTLDTTSVAPRVEVTGTRLPEEQTTIDDLIDLLTQTKAAELPVATTAPTQTVETTGTRITPDELDPFVDLFDKDLVDDRVVVSDKKITPDETVEVTGTRLPPDETVEVTGTRLPPDETVEVTGTRLPPDETVEVTGTRLPPDETVVTTTTTDDTKKDDITDQKVEVKDTKLPPETTTTTTPPTTPPKTSTPVRPTGGGGTSTTTTYAIPTYTPMQGAAPVPMMRPGVVTDAYEVLFGPGAPSIMGFTKAERAKQIMDLARAQEEGENQPETAYDRLMSMADRDPVGTVDQLMQIIEGA